MFNNMKNKIREKTGAELPKFIPPSTMFNKSKSNQHSRQSSLGSINSIASDQGCKEESETKSLNNTEKEDIAIIVNLENKLVEKEKEWREKEKSYIADLQKQRKELAEALALVEENKRKLLCCQEEKDELEVYQKEEISKIKELLLAKEEENNGNMKELKVALSLIEKLKQDVARLTPLEEKINNYQDDLEYLRHTSEKERWNLNSLLVQKDEKIRHLEERNSVLTHRTEADYHALNVQQSTDKRVRSLIAERTLLERRLEEAHIHLSEIKTSWSNKIARLETQVGRLSRQAGEEGIERRSAEKTISELESRIVQYETEKEILQKKLEKLMKERDNIALELKKLSVD